MIYRSVKTEQDCIGLQEDLAQLEKWEDSWCMSFNPDKCSIISITRKKNKLEHRYNLHDQVLKRVDSATYLGVELASDLTWAKRGRHVIPKARNSEGP